MQCHQGRRWATQQPQALQAGWPLRQRQQVRGRGVTVPTQVQLQLRPPAGDATATPRA
jgi:hypothetical protein